MDRLYRVLNDVEQGTILLRLTSDNAASVQQQHAKSQVWPSFVGCGLKPYSVFLLSANPWCLSGDQTRAGLRGDNWTPLDRFATSAETGSGREAHTGIADSLFDAVVRGRPYLSLVGS